MSKKNWFKKLWGKRCASRDSRVVSREMTFLRRCDEILEKCRLIIDYCNKDNANNKLELETVVKFNKKHEENGTLTFEMSQTLDSKLTEIQNRDRKTTVYLEVVKKAQREIGKAQEEIRESVNRETDMDGQICQIGLTDVLLEAEKDLDLIIEENNLKKK